MHLHLLRHAQSLGNLHGDFSTDAHDQLSPQGLEQAELLIPRLHELQLTHFYCSPLKRTLQTIAPFSRTNGQTVRILPDLAEACWAECDPEAPPTDPCYEPTHVLDDFPGIPFRFITPTPLRPTAPESVATGLWRLRNIIRYVKDRHSPGDHVLLVSHGHALARLICMLLSLDPPGDQFHHDNAGMSGVQLHASETRINYLNRVFIGS